MKHFELTARADRLFEVRDTTGTTVVGYIQYDTDRFNNPVDYTFYPKGIEIMITGQTLTGVLMKHFDDTVDITFADSSSIQLGDMAFA